MFDVAQLKLNQQKHIADMVANAQLSLEYPVNKFDSLIERIFTDFPTVDPRVSYHTMCSPIDIVVGAPCVSRPQKLRARFGSTDEISRGAYVDAIKGIITEDLQRLNPEHLYAFSMWIPFYQVPSSVEGCISNRFLVHYSKKVYLDDLYPLKDMISKAEAEYAG